MVGDPSDQDSAEDAGGAALAPSVPLTETQHRIIAALCRPARGENRFATPATNQEIAAEVFLSVDAVKAHLRTLYRKFGIEDLPHNRKRARLVELVVEGGYLGPDAPTPVPDGFAPPAQGGEGETPLAAPARGGRQFRWRPAALALGAIALIVGVLAVAGVFSGGGEASPSTGVAAYRADVSGYCRLALSGQDPSPPPTASARALSYLEVIETLRGRIDSLPPPAAADLSLERFRDGLARAARFTGTVAESPPPAGSREQANVVAELTIAAGQVQAGAIGFELGQSCRAVGNVIAGSAQNAAAP
jgi:hypothetical protein